MLQLQLLHPWILHASTLQVFITTARGSGARLKNPINRVYSNIELPQLLLAEVLLRGASVRSAGDNWRLSPLSNRSLTENVFADVEAEGPAFPMPDDEEVVTIVSRQAQLSGMPLAQLPELPDGFSYAVTTPVWARELDPGGSSNGRSEGTGPNVAIFVVAGAAAVLALSILMCFWVAKCRRKREAHARLEERLTEQVGKPDNLRVSPYVNVYFLAITPLHSLQLQTYPGHGCWVRMFHQCAIKSSLNVPCTIIPMPMCWIV